MSNYAIVESGSKQYWVETDSVIEVEKLGAEEGSKVELERVLFVKDGEKVQIGQPVVSGAKIICDYLGDFKAKKVISFKYRRRKDSKTKRGHRQNLSRLRVKEIVA